jgi:large subunit ribosomal protein L18
MKASARVAKSRQRRTYRIRNKVRAAGRPRLTVFRSNLHIYAQIIDDVAGRTLVSAASTEKSVGGAASDQGNVESAKRVGKTIAERAVKAGITQVAFDRGEYRFHGRVAALAEAARENGLDF